MYSGTVSIVLLSLIVIGAAANADSVPSGVRVIAVHCGHLLDTQAGKLLGDTTVVIEGKRFGAVVAGHQERNRRSA